ncbi:MAG TPA: NUDIX hydrolase [Candidatus Saccharimonadia bacterium]
MDEWTTESSRYIVNDRWLKVRADRMRTPDGHILDPYYVLEYGDWVNCLVIDEEFKVILLQQYRPGAKQIITEIMSGGIEPTDTSPLAAVRRELSEEIGYEDGTIHQTGVCFANPANQPNRVYTFIALGGRATDQHKREPGETTNVIKQPLPHFVHQLTDPTTPPMQALHLSGIWFGLSFLRNSTDPQFAAYRQVLQQ